MNETQPHPEPDADEALALMLAGIAERIALQRLGRPGPGHSLDRAIEATLSRILAEWRPADGIRGSEFGATRPASRRQWLLCPLEGQESHRAGAAEWGIAVGLEEDGSLRTAALAAPLRDEYWTVTRGAGVRRNGRTLMPASQPVLRISERAVELVQHAAVTPEAAETLSRAEVAPAAALWPEMQVASGHVDIEVPAAADSWSAGARRLLIEEAGGRLVEVAARGVCLAVSRPEVSERLLREPAQGAPAGPPDVQAVVLAPELV